MSEVHLNQTEAKFDNVFQKQLLQLSTPIFIVLGIAQLTSYYNQFGLNILNYLEFSEILISFLNYLSLYLFFIIPFYILIIVNTSKKVKTTLIILLITAILYLFYATVNTANENLNSYKITIGTCMTISLILSVCSDQLKIGQNVSEIFVLITFSLIVGVTIAGIVQAKDVKNHHIFSGTTTFINGNEIESSDTVYYIGKTNNYIFYYNSKQKHPIVYPMDKVDKIEIVIKPVERGGDRPASPPHSP